MWNVPSGVRSLTFFLSRSPELIEDTSGNFFIRRSVCVPLPTPGAPTRMMRAALVSAGTAMIKVIARSERNLYFQGCPLVRICARRTK